MGRAGATVETRLSVQVQPGFRGHFAAARDPDAFRDDGGPRYRGLGRRRPAPDVGRAVFQIPASAPLVVQLRPGDDGLRPAGGHGGASGSSELAGDRHRRRRQFPDEHPGTGHVLLRELTGQGAAAEQSASGHGGSVGRPFHGGQSGSHVPGADPSRRGERARRRHLRDRTISRFCADRQRIRLRSGDGPPPRGSARSAA